MARPLQGNAIYLCTPYANPALRAIAPPLTLPAQNAPLLLGTEVPVWFGDDEGKKVIYIASSGRPLPSPAEPEYVRYSRRDNNVPWEPPATPVTDYALILRTTIEGKRIVVIAGIHQYGTWIGGEFFRKLITPGALQPHESIFLSDQDFAAVLWGDFDQTDYSVSRCNVLEEYVWTKTDNAWRRVEAASTASRIMP